MIPMQIPSEIEYIRGMQAIAKKAGIASVGSDHAILLTDCIIMKPTMIRAGAVAKDGIVRKIGEKNSAMTKNRPPKMAVRPVRPPSMIPEEDSTNVVIVDVPIMEPATVPTASERSAPLMPGSFPSLSSIPPRVAQPISVPSVSNMSTKRNAMTTTIKSGFSIAEKSSFINVGIIEVGMEMTADGIRL